MKKTLRFLSCLLIVAMLMTMMTVPAFAATGEITLTGPDNEILKDRDFELYRIFDATVDPSTKAIAYKWIYNGSTPLFYDLFFGSNNPLISTKTEMSPADIVEAVAWIDEQNKKSPTWINDFGKQLYDHITANPSAFAGVKTTETSTGTTETKFVYGGLDYGYYLIYETTPATGAGANEALVRSAILLTNMTNHVDATLKTARATISKTAQRENATLNALSASVDEALNFIIETKVPNFEYYAINPKFVITDIPAESHSFDMPLTSDGYVVTAGSNKLVAGKDYNISINTHTSGSNAEDVHVDNVIFTFTPEFLKSSANQTLTIKYTAYLNERASIGGKNVNGEDKADINEVKLEFSADPYNEEDTNVITDFVRVYSFRLDIYKKSAQEGAALAGAQFKLYNDNTDKWAIINDDGKVTSWTDEEDLASTFTTAINAEGKAIVSVEGLGRGSFELKEIAAPSGYNLPSGTMAFQIGGTLDDVQGVLGTLNLTSTNALISEKTGDADLGIVSMTVSNSTGAELPSTGGMGTTLFTIGGLILMAGAAALLMARKKTEN